MPKNQSRVNTISPVYREMIEKVTDATCQYFSVTKDQLTSEYKLSNARHLCFYIIMENAKGVYDYDIGKFFNRKRTAVQYGIGCVSAHVNIYRQTLGDLNAIVGIANTFEKKYEWHLQPISIQR
ncbi:helix-turn-helix domain-containing protein [Chitinophaga sp. CF418]|uniref:helix-turn-helix domain-containing protein n=1 Tax=Chitinophaga sp. CF418 TaxID=1855287 RepID=UPI00091B91AB|nr:helix-turn-helix domain-containing protein [Chitinophaga sp. CF418]SHN45915.1 dnaA protein helix-turn-helix [Chitinophaga sp. CF418]